MSDLFDYADSQPQEDDRGFIRIPKPPDGWYLYGIRHLKSPILVRNSPGIPLGWLVQFQKLPYGGRLVSGHGSTVQKAWSMAVAETEKD